MSTEIKTTEYHYHPRGVGSNWIACGICGHKNERCQPDMAAWTEGKAGGEAVVELLAACGVKSVLDFRPSEPTWVQVKIGACDAHRGFLEALEKATCKDRKISAVRISTAYETAKEKAWPTLQQRAEARKGANDEA